MPTTMRFYLPSSGAAAVSPAFDSLWDITGSADRLAMSTAPANTVNAGKAASESVSGPSDVLNRQYVGPDDLAAGSLEGTFRTVLICEQSNSGADMFLNLVLKVVSSDGSTVRGVLYAGQGTHTESAVSTDPNYELTTTTTRLSRVLSAALTPVVAQAGDRLVAEYGYSCDNPATTSRAATLHFGDQTADTDLAFTVDTGSASLERPWLEFVFDDVLDPPDTPTDLVATPSTTSILLEWTDALTGGPKDGNEVRIDGGTIVDAGDVLDYDFTALYPSTTHTLEVRAYNAAGESDWASIESTTLVAAEASYTADITIGDHSWIIQAGDEIEPGIQVLDNLRIGWATDESRPWPAQPGTVTCDIGLWTTDVADLDDVVIGTPIAVVLTDVLDNVFATFHGRVAREAAQAKRKAAGMLYALTGTDYTVDLAEQPITIAADWPAEAAEDRFDRIVAALAAVGITLDPPADFGTAAFDAFTAGTTTALELVESHLAQIAIESGYSLQRYVVAPVVVADVLDRFSCVLLEAVVDASLLPGTLVDNGGVLELAFPDMAADGVVDACAVDLGATWNRLKYRAATQVTVSGPVTGTATRPGPPVRLNLQTTLTDQAAADAMAALYLPDVDESNGWVADTFRLNAHLVPVAITPAWFPDHRDDPANLAVYAMPLALVGIPANINLAGDLDVYAGQLVKVDLRIAKRRIYVDFSLRRQLPTSDGADALTWDALAADFPTLTWDDIDPSLTWYDLRLARRP